MNIKRSIIVIILCALIPVAIALCLLAVSSAMDSLDVSTSRHLP